MVWYLPFKEKNSSSNLLGYTFGCIAQLVEHGTFNLGVEGSSPSAPTKYKIDINKIKRGIKDVYSNKNNY